MASEVLAIDKGIDEAVRLFGAVSEPPQELLTDLEKLTAYGVRGMEVHYQPALSLLDGSEISSRFCPEFGDLVNLLGLRFMQDCGLRYPFQRGEISLRRLGELRAGWVVDLDPSRPDGQMFNYRFDSDYLSSLMSSLREQKKIMTPIESRYSPVYPPIDSRFGATLKEITDVVLPAFRLLIGVNGLIGLRSYAEYVFRGLTAHPEWFGGDKDHKPSEFLGDKLGLNGYVGLVTDGQQGAYSLDPDSMHSYKYFRPRIFYPRYGLSELNRVHKEPAQRDLLYTPIENFPYVTVLGTNSIDSETAQVLNSHFRTGGSVYDVMVRSILVDQSRVSKPILVDFNGVLAGVNGNPIVPNPVGGWLIDNLRRTGSVMVITAASDWNLVQNFLEENGMWHQDMVLMCSSNYPNDRSTASIDYHEAVRNFRKIAASKGVFGLDSSFSYPTSHRKLVGPVFVEDALRRPVPLIDDAPDFGGHTFFSPGVFVFPVIGFGENSVIQEDFDAEGGRYGKLNISDLPSMIEEYYRNIAV